MIPTLDQRIWIIFCWYLVLQCFFTGQHTNAASSSGSAADRSLRLLDDSELALLGIYRQHPASDETAGSFSSVSRSSGVPSPRAHEAPFLSGPGSTRINNNRKINLVSYTASIDNILNSFEDENDDDNDEDDDDVVNRRFELGDHRIVTTTSAKPYERNHEADVRSEKAAQPARHRLLVNQIVQKYYPNQRRHRRSLLLRRSARSIQTDPESGDSKPKSDEAFASSSFSSLVTLSPSSISTTTPPPIVSAGHQRTRIEPVVHEPSNQMSSSNYNQNSEYDKPEKNGKMAVTDIIRSNNSEHNFASNLTLANVGHSSSGNNRASAGVASGTLSQTRTQDAAGPEVEHQTETKSVKIRTALGEDSATHQRLPVPETNTSTQSAVISTQTVTATVNGRAAEVVSPGVSAVVERTITPREHLPRNSYSATNVDSFNLLDVGVPVSNSSERMTVAAIGGVGAVDSSSTHTSEPKQHETRTSNNIFAGENFDEQIIFLNGGDLLEASPEQYDMRQFGKVERDIGMSDLRNINPFLSDEPIALPLRPIIRGPTDDHTEDNVVVIYAEQHETVTLACEVDADITSSVWLKDGQMVHIMDKKSRTDDVRFVRESHGGITIRNVMLEDDGVWQCEAENARGFFFNGRPIKLVVLDPPKEPYLLIDQRRLDAGNMFIPVKENSELTLACVSEGGNPKPSLSWEVLLSPGIDRHAQKISNDVLELQEIKRDKDKEPYKINTGAISEAKLPAVFRVHHNARILCVMEHPTLKMRQNASILLDVQYTPSFAITRTPGFGYPLREGIEVSLKCDVDSNPPSTPVWQKDDGETPVPQTGDGFLNFSSIRREHSGWYKCTSRHLNFQYSSIGYYLSVRYDSVDVTSEPVEQDLPLSSSSSSSSATSAAAGLQLGANNFKGGQMEVELGGSVTLQCPQGSLGCWSHLDPITARLKGLGVGISTPTGQFSLKDVVYQDAGTYKCVGQSSTNRKKLEVLQTVSIAVKGAPTVIARNTTPVAFPGSPLHLSVEFCANPPAYAARWLHGDLVYTPGKKYGDDVLAYGFIDLPTPFCKEARLTYVHMHEKVPRTFYFIVSSPGGVAEAIFNVNFTLKHKTTGSSLSSFSASSASSSGGSVGIFGSASSSFPSVSSSSSSSSSSASASGGGGLSSGGSGYKINTNTINNMPNNGLDEDEELMEPEEIHFPIFGSGANGPSLLICKHYSTLYRCYSVLLALLTCFRYVLLKY
ncbi:uncharacterized protein LOC129725692 [Wyeomyia smithii]|uniref:uncharacterized protein LOC129725692 n=1 Tax=Wyeomyia smithii TaxID=174621 RepID=UPI0024682038|nr:uncharacterized protein LOC129725692 [Wyeomyia smithii]